MDGFRTLLTRLQEFKDVKEKIESLEPQLDRFKQIITATTGGDPGEIERRAKLTRYARQLFVSPTKPTVFAVHWKRSRSDRRNC